MKRQKPRSLHHCGRVFGLLSSTEQEDDYQIVRIGNDAVILPAELDLSGYTGQRIGVARIEDRYFVREATASEEMT